MTKEKTTFNINKEKNFSEWYSEILARAELVDIRYGVKGFVVIRPWGAKIIENMYRIYQSALQRTGHQPTFFPTVIPKENFTKEAEHVEGFTPEVFWIENNKQEEEQLALRPTSETAMYKMYAMWIRSHRDLPLKIYQRANVFRSETKATRPLIRGREFYWIEAHDVFATKKEAENQVQEDIEMTKQIMTNIFGIPFLPMKRPEWDKFPGAEYTVGSDSILPDGKIIQQPSTHMLGQHFAKAFNVTYTDEKEKEQHAWQTCYGPAISRILASVISVHGDDKGLQLPYTIAPLQTIIIPHYNKENKKEILKKAQELQQELFNEKIEADIDDTEKRPGEKYYYWEMKGVPIRIEIGTKELEKKEATIVLRDTKEKKTIPLKELSEEIKNLGTEYDERLKEKAKHWFENKITTCNTKEEVQETIQKGNIAKFPYCNTNKEGEQCAEHIEKEMNARIMGTKADKKETPTGNCIYCNKKATTTVYAGKSY